MKYKTNAQQAEEELNEIIGPDKHIYKAWQLEDYTLQTVHLQGTIDDFMLLVNGENYTRPKFAVSDDKVYVPNFFVKLNGAVAGFELDIKQLSRRRSDIVEVYSSFKKMAVPPHHRPLKGRPEWFGGDDQIDVAAALKKPLGNIRYLRPAYQKNYLMAINRVLKIINSDDFLPKKPTGRDVLETLLFNSNKIIRMYHNYDYQYLAPKFVVTDDNSFTISIYAVIRLLMMHALGFDVVVMSEKGYASIENYLSENICDRHFVTEKERVYSKVLKRREAFKRKLKYGLAIAAGLLLLLAMLKIVIGF